MKKYFTTLFISLLTISVWSSCEKQENLISVENTLYVNHEGAQMPVYIYGNGTKKQMIVLVHGGPGGSSLDYRFGEYSQILEDELMVAYWDQRGQGMAQGKYGLDNLNIQQMADDLEAVVLAVKKKYGDDLQVFLLGHSWGGTLGTKFMIEPQKANLVAGWIEANGAHDLPLLNQEAIKMFRKISTEQIKLGNSVENWQSIKNWADGIDEKNITNEISGQINAKSFEVENYLLEDGIINGNSPGNGDLKLLLNSPINWAKSAITGNYTNRALNDEIEATSLTSQLQNIEKPCLFIGGKYDFVVPPALSIDAFEKVSSTNKRLVILERSGHSTMSSEAKLFAKEVLDFVQSVSK